jgi:hypothetical protein
VELDVDGAWEHVGKYRLIVGDAEESPLLAQLWHRIDRPQEMAGLGEAISRFRLTINGVSPDMTLLDFHVLGRV